MAELDGRILIVGAGHAGGTLAAPLRQQGWTGPATLAGGTKPPSPAAPWFWSDQYNLKLQSAGRPIEAPHVVVRGEPGAACFAVFHMNTRNQIRAVEAINAAPESMAGRKLIACGQTVELTRLADISISMKEVAA